MSRLKIKPEHLDFLKSACMEVLAENPEVVQRYEEGRFVRSEKVKDLQKRFAFDILHAAKIQDFVIGKLYPYMNDDNLYSALKSFLPKIVKKY